MWWGYPFCDKRCRLPLSSLRCYFERCDWPNFIKSRICCRTFTEVGSGLKTDSPVSFSSVALRTHAHFYWDFSALALVVLRVGLRLSTVTTVLPIFFHQRKSNSWSPCRRNNPLVSICAAGVGNIDVNHYYRCARDIPCWWSHPHRVSLVPNAQSSRPRLIAFDRENRECNNPEPQYVEVRQDCPNCKEKERERQRRWHRRNTEQKRSG